MARTIVLQPSRKVDLRGHRTVAVDATVERALQLRERFGISRIADITGLDTLGIPVFSAVRPGSKMQFTVHSGKGLTPGAALASALMEAIEVATAETVTDRLPVRMAAAREFDGENVRYVHPMEVFFALPGDAGMDDLVLRWVEGYDIAEDTPVWVPADFVHLGETDSPLPGRLRDTNGLASGNTLEEAVYHGLAEVVERDACLLHYFLTADLGLGPRSGWQVPRRIALATLPSAGRELSERIVAAGLRLHLLDMTVDLRVPVIRALIEESSWPRARTHANDGRIWFCGAGAAPSAEVAMLRAITEAAQSRAVNIQGTREDLDVSWGEGHPSGRGGQPDPEGRERAGVVRRRGFELSWMWHRRFRRVVLDDDAATVPFGELPDRVEDDVSADIRFVLARLASVGCHRVIVVDLSIPPTGLAVVKVLVPGLPLSASPVGYPRRLYERIL